MQWKIKLFALYSEFFLVQPRKFFFVKVKSQPLLSSHDFFLRKDQLQSIVQNQLLFQKEVRSLSHAYAWIQNLHLVHLDSVFCDEFGKFGLVLLEPVAETFFSGITQRVVFSLLLDTPGLLERGICCELAVYYEPSRSTEGKALALLGNKVARLSVRA